MSSEVGPSGTPSPSTPVRKNEYENPWESAANDRLWESATATTSMEGSSTRALLMDDGRHNNHQNSLYNRDSAAAFTTNNSSFGFQCFRACHLLDIVGGSILALYSGLVLLKQNRGPAIALMTVACLVILRGVLAKITRKGVALSATVSWGLTGLYGLASLVTYGIYLLGGKRCNYIPFDYWCHKLTLPMVALVLLLSGIVELIRYLWIRQWMMEEASQVRDDLNASEVTYQRRRRRQQPWWWQSPSRTTNTRGISTDSLLLHEGGGGGGGDGNNRPHWSSSDSRGYHMDHGGGDVGSPSRTGGRGSSWWPFSNTRRSSTADVRDDGSVEYASLNEDWASRSQEDPFWWTREEGGH